MTYRTIRTRLDGTVCHLQLYRPQARNTINDEMIHECREVLARCEESASVVVLEGLPEVFCFGADFQAVAQSGARHTAGAAGAGASDGRASAELLFEVWEKLATGPFISVAHVRGQTNAGGIGFVSACDIVLADDTARFSLSELLFGLYPACVLPFLARRIGLQKANFMTVSTQPISVEQASAWGLVDAHQAASETLLNRHLQRLRRLPKASIGHYKRYVRELAGPSEQIRTLAVRNNREMQLLPGVLAGIARYVETGRLPWEL